jgi:ABC-type glycerol-3-phosphate transport system permease component
MTRVPLLEKRIRSSLLHIALAGFSILFSLPFLWLVGTSCKVTEEMVPIRWFPEIPPPVVQSPYISIRERDRPTKPAVLLEDAWARLLPAIRQSVATKTIEVGKDLPPFYSAYLALPEMTDGVLLRLLRRTPQDLFSRPEEAVIEWFAQETSPALVQEVFETIYRRMAVSDIVFRSRNIIVEERIAAENCPWQVVSGNAILISRSEGLRHPDKEIHYQFNQDKTFSVQTIVPVSLPLEQIDKIIVSYRADFSWHEVWAVVEISGKRYTAELPAYLGSERWQETTWRFNWGEESAMNMRTWIWLREDGESDFRDQGKARITLEVRYCPRWRASLNKLLANYREVLRMVPVRMYIKNSAILVSLNIAGQILASSVVAFAFARLRWPGREFCFMLMLATLMIPPQVSVRYVDREA